MGFFNNLFISTSCPDCHQQYELPVQFKYGKTYQLKYKLNDAIEWHGYDDIGSPDLQCVSEYSIAEFTNCPHCGLQNIAEDYDLIIKHGIIVSIGEMKNMQLYLDSGVDGGDYFVPDDFIEN